MEPMGKAILPESMDPTLDPIGVRVWGLGVEGSGFRGLGFRV